MIAPPSRALDPSPRPGSRPRSLVRTASAAALLGALVAAAGQAVPSGPPAVDARPVPRPPIFFAANAGQHPDDVRFHAGGIDVEAAFGSTGVTFSRAYRDAEPGSASDLDRGTSADAGARGPLGRGIVIDAATGRPRPPAPITTESARLEFVGARPDAQPEGLDPLPTTLNFLKGPRERWKVGIPTYARIVYRDLWEGIDLEYAGVSGAVKYTFVVHPGADPSRIRLAWHTPETSAEAQAGVRITPEGTLEIRLGRGRLDDGRPVALQTDGDRTENVAADFVLGPDAATFVLDPDVGGADDPSGAGDPIDAGDAPGRADAPAHARGVTVVGFDIGPYDPTRPLIIDPAYPVYAGYFGTSAFDRGLGISVHAGGHAYITGETTDPDTEDTDAYVAKIALDGSGYDYISFVGGDWYDGAYDIAVDAAGHAYITGPTMSDEDSFPLTMGPDLSFNGTMDVLVAKLSPEGDDLVYAGYLGGELTDFGEGIRVDDSGAVYLHGIALSTQATFPVKVGPDLTFNGESDAFVAKIRPVPDAADVADNVVYAGYIGGDRSDITLLQQGTWSTLSSGHIGIDAEGALYVSGQTTSAEDTFPGGEGFGDLPGAQQAWSGGWDAYVVKIAPDGGQLEYATYVGGDGTETGKGMVIDEGGHAFFTGYTDSTEDSLPVTVGPDLSANGDLDVFVGKLAPDGAAFDFLGFFGGDDVDAADSITLDAEGRPIIVGYTESLPGSFPVKNGPDDTHNDLEDGAGDAFVARLLPDPSAPELVDNVDFAGYIGGAAYDQAFWVGLDGAGAVYVVGDTESGPESFPNGEGLGDLPGPNRDLPGGGDGFVIKLGVGDAVPTTPPGPDPTETPGGEHLVHLPAVLDTAELGGGMLARGPGGPGLPGGVAVAGGLGERRRGDARGRAFDTGVRAAAASPETGRPAARALVRPAAQAGLVERSFDDFCDFVVGWSWEGDDDFDVRLNIDDLGVCTYIMTRLSPGAYGSSSFGRPAPEDFHLQTRVHLDGSGGAAGLMFGASERLDSAYVFALFDSGQYVLAHFGAEVTTLDAGTTELDPTAPIDLAVEAQGDLVTLLVDGEAIAEVADAGPHAGRVGTYIEADGDGLPFTSTFDFIRISERVEP